MFDNRWDNWAGDYAESFVASLLPPAVRGFVPEILGHFKDAATQIDPEFPDFASPGTFAKVMTESMPLLRLPDAARPLIPDVVAGFFETLQDSGRLADGDDWAAQIRSLEAAYRERLRPGGGVRGVTIRKSEKVSPLGRNDPCPCGSGKKYKKCCMQTKT